MEDLKVYLMGDTDCIVCPELTAEVLVAYAKACCMNIEDVYCEELNKYTEGMYIELDWLQKSKTTALLRELGENSFHLHLDKDDKDLFGTIRNLDGDWYVYQPYFVAIEQDEGFIKEEIKKYKFAWLWSS